MFNVRVEKQGKAPFHNLVWKISDDLYLQWNSFSRSGQDWASNVIALYKDKESKRKLIAQIKLSSERLYTDYEFVHEEFINLVLNNSKSRHSIVKQIFRGPDRV